MARSTMVSDPGAERKCGLWSFEFRFNAADFFVAPISWESNRPKFSKESTARLLRFCAGHELLCHRDDSSARPRRDVASGDGDDLRIPRRERLLPGAICVQPGSSIQGPIQSIERRDRSAMAKRGNDRRRFGDVADRSGSFGCDSGPRLLRVSRGFLCHVARSLRPQPEAGCKHRVGMEPHAGGIYLSAAASQTIACFAGKLPAISWGNGMRLFDAR